MREPKINDIYKYVCASDDEYYCTIVKIDDNKYPYTLKWESDEAIRRFADNVSVRAVEEELIFVRSGIEPVTLDEDLFTV